MTDKKWVIICDCAWCNGEGETHGNDPSKKSEECRECDGHGIEEFTEDSDEFKNEREARKGYKGKNILFVALVDRAWGSPTTTME
jgi:DnaJ-class molecular chaperone|tara:strand:+ start:304 stop:558 length:255 start_codon:yes stop_codon:yes gene_type:complete